MPLTIQSSAEKVPSALIHTNAAGAMDADSTTGGESLGDALAALRKEISGLILKIANTGNEPCSVIAHLERKISDLQSMSEASGLLSVSGASVANKSQASPLSGAVSAPVIVPDNLPLFQWSDYIVDDKSRIFTDVQDCLRRFEDVLFSYGLDYDHSWRRLLPICFCQGMRDWLSDFVKTAGNDAPWHTLKDVMIQRYGVFKVLPCFDRIRKFMNCTMEEQESVDTFLERFRRLRAESGINDKHLIAKVFVDAMCRESS